MSEWKTVSLRQDLIKEIEKAIKTGRYRSVAEFISEAIRLRLEELVRAEVIPNEMHKEILFTPEQLLYTPKHIWAQMTSEGNVRIGVSDYAKRHLKDISQIRTEPVGTEVKKMKPFGVAETWMFMFNLYAPVSGNIVRINENLRENPNILNEDPYTKGWIIEIKPKNSIILKQELSSMLGSREYKRWVSKLEGRLFT